MSVARQLGCLSVALCLQFFNPGVGVHAQERSTDSILRTVAASRCGCGRWTCQACQQQILCPPTTVCPPLAAPRVEPPTVPATPDMTAPVPDAPVTHDAAPSADFPSPTAPTPSPSAASLFASNQAAAAGAFGSSLLGATAPEMMGDFFGPTIGMSEFFNGTNRILLPVPNAGYNLGRMKQSENSTPIPTDRVFFNYSLFGGVPLAVDPITVNRFTPGFETTFFDGMASVELRVPFGTTQDTSISVGGITSDDRFQFGNLFVTLKGLLFEQQDSVLTCGLSVLIPTADDIKLLDPTLGNTEFLRITNESTHIMPFIGGACTRSDRLFAQWILQVDIDTTGNAVITAPDTSRASKIGTLQDFTILYGDLSLGYWLIRNPGNRVIRGVAPIAELHFNRSLNSADFVSDGLNTVFQTVPELDNLNTTLGCVFQLQNQCRLAVGYATPFGNDADRMFDNELRVTLNRSF